MSLFLACSKPRDLGNGYYDEERVKNYREGQKVSFTCNEFAKRIPSDGIIECGSNGWSIDHKCVRSKMIATTFIECRL